MALLELQGATLGEKHQHYNKLVQERSREVKKQESMKLDSAKGDIENLIKIDIANNNKDVEYILEVFKSEDSLYVSRAIKRSTWIINDLKYAHIINPKYLHDQLFPQMTSKAINKLMLHIRVNLKDEQRVEAFYKYEDERDRGRAVKWLPNCSIAFIERVVKGQIFIYSSLLRRLIHKSFSVAKLYIHDKTYRISEVLESQKLFLNTNTEQFLNLIESCPDGFGHINFGEKSTHVVMAKCPERVLDNFQRYANMVHTKAFVKYIKREDLKDFLIKHSKNKALESYFTFENLKEFVTRMPIEGRFTFVMEIFIEKTLKNDELSKFDNLIISYTANIWSSDKEHQWYQFAPFEIAFPDLKKLIRAESSPIARKNMLGILITCAKHDMQHIHTILQFYQKELINEPFVFKFGFINSILSQVDTHACDHKTWNALNEIFYSMEVYVESNNNVQSCIEAIIAYKILHGQDIPEIIEKKFEFSTFKATRMKLKTKEEKSTVFNYLYIYLLTKVHKKHVNNESDFNEMVIIIKNILNLLVDWDKQLLDHPVIVNKIRELIRIRRDNSWIIDLSCIYNIKKSWRKHLFEESVIMCPSENVCVNALKHDPELLLRHESEVEGICCNDAVSLKRVHSKLRVYWPQTLAEKWKCAYLERLDKPGSDKALVRGLCVLLSENPLLEIIKTYAPQEGKIDWNPDDEHTLSLRKYISKTMHIARPLIPLDAVLLYAKGDYLQYAVPSINAILNNQSCNKSRTEIPKLLNAPVSLQKFGIRYAFQKLQPEELKTIFHELWKSSKNPTIRTILFTHTYDLLCKEKDYSMINELKHLLCLFIDSLTADENKKIYNKLSMVHRVPLDVIVELYKKSYLFLSSLPKKTNCESIVQSLFNYGPAIMHLLDSEFVENVLLKSVVEMFSTEDCDIFDMLASYLLSTNDEESQLKKYSKFFLPIIDTEVARELLQNNKMYRSNLNKLLDKMSAKLKTYLIGGKTIAPVKMFTNIHQKLESILKIHENYEMITFWKLTVCYVTLVNDFKYLLTLESDMMGEDSSTDDVGEKWNLMNSNLQASFADQCVNYLKEDVRKYFPSIYPLFGRALDLFFMKVHSENTTFTYNIFHLILREDFIPSYLLVISIWPYYSYNKKDETGKLLEVRKILSKHPSPEVKIHYFSKFQNKSDTEI